MVLLAMENWKDRHLKSFIQRLDQEEYLGATTTTSDSLLFKKQCSASLKNMGFRYILYPVLGQHGTVATPGL